MALPFEKFVDLVVEDKEFRKLLKKDPEQALRAVLPVTPGLVTAVRKLDWASLERVAASYRKATRISC